ncbi:TetR/AcrR family transcriptional regulator [Actinocatenispora comari]|nr:TetR/AcrR family transcriptional regulator [Actinocatenispora comari]
MTETTRRVPAGDRAERKRAAIVQAARAEFLRQGFGVSMDLIAARAGVSKVTVYNHFGSKEELFTAVVGDSLEHALGEPAATLEKELVDPGDLRQMLTRTVHAWVRGMTEPDVLALRSLVTSEIRRFPELGASWEAGGPGRVSPILETLFRDLAKQGVLAMPDVEVAVIQLYSLVLYPHFVYATYGGHIEPALTERLIAAGIDMFLEYYEADRA